MTWDLLWHQNLIPWSMGNLLNGKNRTISFQIPVYGCGTGVRVHLSNLMNKRRAYIGGISLLYKGIFYEMTFGGTKDVAIQAYSECYSDELKIELTPGDVVELRMYYTGNYAEANLTEEQAKLYKGNALLSEKAIPMEKSFLEKRSGAYYPIPHIDKVEILRETPAKKIIAFGDSITCMSRWTKPLAKRIFMEYGEEYFLVNTGISGSSFIYENMRGLNKLFGEMRCHTVERDVLSYNPDIVIFAFGVNDVANMTEKNREAVNVEVLIRETKNFVKLMHERGIRVVGNTVVPRIGYSKFTEFGEVRRLQFNAWMRSTDVFDYVLDVEAVVRDPQNPSVYAADLHQGDWLHPNVKGGQLIADSYDLKMLVGHRKSAEYEKNG